MNIFFKAFESAKKEKLNRKLLGGNVILYSPSSKNSERKKEEREKGGEPGIDPRFPVY